jgi:hypothetical protein
VPDICDLILDEHDRFRRRFAELDDISRNDRIRLQGVWTPLAELLDRHADAEERIFYPLLLHHGQQAESETEDAISDHNEIRDAVRHAQELDAGSEAWWRAVMAARTHNSTHMGEEERGALADFRRHVEDAIRHDAGARWVRFTDAHAGDRRVDHRDKDPHAYVASHEGPPHE